MHRRSLRASHWLLTGTVIHLALRPVVTHFAIEVEGSDFASRVFQLTRGAIELDYYGSCLLAAWLLLQEARRPHSNPGDSLLRALVIGLLIVQLPVLIFPGHPMIVAVGVILCGTLALTVLMRRLKAANWLCWCATACWGASYACAMQSAWCAALGVTAYVRGFQVTVVPLRFTGQWAWFGMLSANLLFCVAQGGQLRRWLPPMIGAMIGGIAVAVLLVNFPQEILLKSLDNLGLTGQSDRFLIAAVVISLLLVTPRDDEEEGHAWRRAMILTSLAGWGWQQSWQQLISAVALLQIDRCRHAAGTVVASATVVGSCRG